MRIGIDLGGSKIEGLALAPGGGERARRRVDTPRGDYDATIAAVRDLVAAVAAEAGARRYTVGVGIPGTLSADTGLVKNANSTWLIGRPLDRDLAAALGRPVRLANDANCFALSEAKDGAARGAHLVFGAILGTGTGGGIVREGQVLAGRNGIAGEWGHNPLPWPDAEEWPGPDCYCGRRGCIETFLSGPGLSQTHAVRTGMTRAASDIAAAAARGEAAAAATLSAYETRLSKALASVINVLDPDVIVLGGGLSQIGRLYETVPRLWRAFVFSDSVETRLLPPRHGPAGGVRGAAWLWPEATA